MTLAKIFLWIISYQYLILFPIVIVEGPIITIIAGFLSSLGILNPFIVYPIVVLGDTTGDALYYAIGRWGRKGLITRFGRYFGMTEERIERFEGYLKRHMGRTIFFGKFSHALCAPILLAAGAAKIPFKKYISFSILATIPKSLILLLVGIYFGQAYAKIGKYLDITAIVGVVLGVVLVLFYLYLQRLTPKLAKDSH